jgi:hypothetical protein
MQNLKQEFIKKFGAFENIKCAFISFKPFNNIDEDGDTLVDDDDLEQLPKDSFVAHLKVGHTKAELMEFIEQINFNFLDSKELSENHLEDMGHFTFKCWFVDGSYTEHLKETIWNGYDSNTYFDFHTIIIPIITSDLI